ncbi:Alkyl/aryl-sulfatase BDS1 [Metarhizium brunneum]|uniref:Alkyl/aryl-sulfatase BDS1 n=1 Tax=Metarhizium brunneum TaxID=500148 RepID=A0A7D5ZBH8_9HYPO|nr:Alkyl/aryl-sulfatase BDS1 [Metarhizium brunneum]
MASKAAAEVIRAHNQQARQSLPFDDETDFQNATKGRIGTRQPNVITNAAGAVIWDNDSYKFLENEAPDTVHPSLWRQAQLCRLDGLFQVTEGIYQVRGLDLSNTTFVEGDEGLVIIDALTCSETAAAALQLYQQHRGKHRRIRAIVYTHCHADHFGGVKGFVTEDQVHRDDIKIIAPEGFLEHAVSENERIAAGVRMVFQMAPDTEAPAEMLVYLPQFRALCAAEDATHTLHNILTPRGAVVRDAHRWSRLLTETIDLFGGRADVVFASHHWPTWGQRSAVDFLASQRDLYGYLHDQTLRLLNRGLTGPEIAEAMALPPALEGAWAARGYYGSLSHNVKAIYQRYMGWFDGNPSHLWEHPPADRARRYLKLAGGAGQVVDRAREALGEGDFRWAAEILNHVVFAEPEHAEARALLADTYEQLGYGSENGPWRNFYMSGAAELRGGKFGAPTSTASGDVVGQLTPEMVFDSLAVRVDGPRAWGQSLAIDVVLVDAGERYRLWLSNGVLVYSAARREASPDVTLSATRRQLCALVGLGRGPDALRAAGIEIDGDVSVLARLGGLLDPGDRNFDIVTP